MSDAPKKKGDKDDVVKVDFAFRRELARKVEGNLASFCYQCGACVGDCPATTYSEEFNPREIMLQVLYGLGGELLGEDSLLWQCTNCYNCHERCPQEVKPVEVIISLKNMLADRGMSPEAVDKVIKTFEGTGRTVAPNPAIDRQRAKFGLPPMPEVPVDEIATLLEPGGGTAPAEVEAKVPEEAPAEEGGAKKMAFFAIGMKSLIPKTCPSELTKQSPVLDTTKKT
jgi:heterodisulfide reductase subunit C